VKPPLPTPPPWDSNALWMKAKLFINYALDDKPERTFDERALWASLSLELLGKAALSRASPLLIAVPNEEGKNLLAAAGLTDDQATFKTITASTVFKRCALAFKPFNDVTAIRIAEDRNAYLHSAATTFTPIPEAAWWPRFWALAHILVNACDRDLEQFVGTARVRIVEEALAQNQRNVDERVHMLLERAKQRLARYAAGEMRGSELRDWERSTNLKIGLAYATPETCPACGEDEGTLEGDDVISTEMHYEHVSEDDYDVWVDLEIAAEYFSCANCRFTLESSELLQATKLPESFEALGDPADFYEPDYGND
jgi:hypothetical protein